MNAGWDPRGALSEVQRAQLDAYGLLLLDMNRRLNLISRTSEAEAELRHLTHSLVLGWKRFPAGSRVVDWGTGGGLPGVPLAIRFPDVRFALVESIGKKASAVAEMARTLGLSNVEVWNGRAEAWTGQVTHAVSRATAPLIDLWKWTVRVLEPAAGQPGEGDWPRGLVCLKGGDLSEEIKRLRRADPGVRVDQLPLDRLLESPVFVEKYIVAVRAGEGG